MLHRYSEVFRTGLLLSDLVLVSASWLAAYALRFHAGFPVPQGIPDFVPYAWLLVAIVPIWFQLYRSRGLYEPQRTRSVAAEAAAVVVANAMGVLALGALAFFGRQFAYSRAVLGLFFGLASVGVIATRATARIALRAARRRGYNLRFVLGVGAGETMERFASALAKHPEAGLRLVGVLSSRPSHLLDARVAVIGGYERLKHELRDRRIDQVVIALPREEAPLLEKILADLDDEMVSVRIIPDLFHVMSVRSSVEELEGLPVICLRDSPLLGLAAVQKRVFDVMVCATLLCVLAPVLGAIALAIRLTSGRPILFEQERMGLDGRLFPVLKFRTMAAEAERETGPVWTVPDDPRRTRLGAWLRSTSLDELPQLWNVLRGDMSLVGPRPERPVFIAQFRREVPGYMLRHKVKAGLTGWAQVHGWRGNTSLHERVEHDLYYIQHWSLGLDVRILLMTLWRGLVHRNAY